MKEHNKMKIIIQDQHMYLWMKKINSILIIFINGFNPQEKSISIHLNKVSKLQIIFQILFKYLHQNYNY